MEETREACETQFHMLKLQRTFTRQMRVCQLKKVGEKVGESKNKFNLSPTVCQRVCQLLMSRSHPDANLSSQHKFANLSLSCERALRESFDRIHRF